MDIVSRRNDGKSIALVNELENLTIAIFERREQSAFALRFNGWSFIPFYLLR
jgi:hypothetical protein